MVMASSYCTPSQINCAKIDAFFLKIFEIKSGNFVVVETRWIVQTNFVLGLVIKSRHLLRQYYSCINSLCLCSELWTTKRLKQFTQKAEIIFREDQNHKRKKRAAQHTFRFPARLKHIFKLPVRLVELISWFYELTSSFDIKLLRVEGATRGFPVFTCDGRRAFCQGEPVWIDGNVRRHLARECRVSAGRLCLRDCRTACGNQAEISWHWAVFDFKSDLSLLAVHLSWLNGCTVNDPRVSQSKRSSQVTTDEDFMQEHWFCHWQRDKYGLNYKL